jgi:hypothetical protein
MIPDVRACSTPSRITSPTRQTYRTPEPAPFAHVAERLGLPGPRRPILEGPGGWPSVLMVWASTRGKAPRTRTRAPCGRLQRSSITRLGDTSACHHYQERHGQPAVTARGSGAASVGPALPGCTRRGPELCPGPRGAASLWACSQQARHPRPSPPRPWRAGPVGRARNPEPANALAATQN